MRPEYFGRITYHSRALRRTSLDTRDAHFALKTFWNYSVPAPPMTKFLPTLQRSNVTIFLRPLSAVPARHAALQHYFSGRSPASSRAGALDCGARHYRRIPRYQSAHDGTGVEILKAIRRSNADPRGLRVRLGNCRGQNLPASFRRRVAKDYAGL